MSVLFDLTPIKGGLSGVLLLFVLLISVSMSEGDILAIEVVCFSIIPPDHLLSNLN